jgi:hypothetical protein
MVIIKFVLKIILESILLIISLIVGIAVGLVMGYAAWNSGINTFDSLIKLRDKKDESL